MRWNENTNNYTVHTEVLYTEDDLSSTLFFRRVFPDVSEEPRALRQKLEYKKGFPRLIATGDRLL
jgi:hypothetical protein